MGVDDEGGEEHGIEENYIPINMTRNLPKNKDCI
jgi:hypothetical protein